MDNNKTKVIVLAAGQGKRLHSEEHDAPKVMRLADGRPLLSYVLSALDFIPPEDIVIVVGYKRDQVERAFPDYCFAVQEEQLGTGHAVKAALTTLPDFNGNLLVCCGDMPLIKRETYSELLNSHGDNACTILSGESDDALTYGRIVRGENNEFVKIVEHKDCTDEERAITELNSGVYVFSADTLRATLPQLGRGNAQGEEYLTDVPKLALGLGMTVGVCRVFLGNQMIGVNTPEQLEDVERIIREEKLTNV